MAGKNVHICSPGLQDRGTGASTGKSNGIEGSGDTTDVLDHPLDAIFLYPTPLFIYGLW